MVRLTGYGLCAASGILLVLESLLTDPAPLAIAYALGMLAVAAWVWRPGTATPTTPAPAVRRPPSREEDRIVVAGFICVLSWTALRVLSLLRDDLPVLVTGWLVWVALVVALFVRWRRERARAAAGHSRRAASSGGGPR